MSLLKIIRQQLGLSTTPANNFTLDASADNGTMKLARGNAGETTQDIITVNAAGVVSLPQGSAGILPSQTSNGGKFLTTDGTSASWGTVSVPVTSFQGRTGAISLTAADIRSTISLTAGSTYEIRRVSGSRPGGTGLQKATTDLIVYGSGTVTLRVVGTTSNFQPYNVSVYVYKNGSNVWYAGAMSNGNIDLSNNLACSDLDVFSVYLNDGPSGSGGSDITLIMYTNSAWRL